MPTPTITRIPMIFVNVADMARARTWYEQILGLTLDEHNAAHFENIDLVLLPFEKTTPASHALFAFVSPDVYQAHAAMSAGGADLDPMEDYGPCIGFTFRDPDGNKLCMTSVAR